MSNGFDTLRTRTLWETLVNDGYDIGSYKEFLDKLSDSVRISKLHTFLQANYDVGPFKDFAENLKREDTDKVNAIKNIDKMLSSEDNSKYPSAFKMGRNLASDTWKSMKAFARGKEVMTSADKAFERLEICKGCEFYTEEKRCTKCGCFMEVKTHFEASECPIKKW